MPVRMRKALNGDSAGPMIAQRQHAAGDGEGEIAERLVQHDAVIFRPRLAQHRIAPLARPVEGAGIDDEAADRIAVAAEKFGQRMHDDVGAVIDRLAQIRRSQRVVDDVGHAGALGDLRHRRHVGDDAAGIGDRLGEDRLGLRRDRALERADVVGIGPHHVPAEILERVVELVDRAAIELFATPRTRRPAAAGSETPAPAPHGRTPTASPAVPPSSAATRSSSTALVGLPMRV